MFEQASKFRIETHPTAPLCATIYSLPESGPRRGSSGSGSPIRPITVSLPSTVKSYQIQIADQTYNVKSEMASGSIILEVIKRSNLETEISIKTNFQLQEISVKLCMEIYDTYQKFEPLTGLNPIDELREILNRLGA